MRARLRTRVAWSGFGLSAMLIAGSLGLVATHLHGVLVPELLLMAGALCYACVGALIALRQPANRIGWLLLATGLLSSVALGVATYGFTALSIAAGSLPAGIWATWTFGWLIWSVLIAIPLAVLIFPDGRPPSRRWWIVGATLIASGVLLALMTMLRPGPIVIPPDPSAIGANPAGLAILAGVEDHFFKPINGIYLAAVLAAGAAPIWRFHRSRREERQQLKVLAYVGAWIVALQIVTYPTGLSRVPVISDILWSLSFAGLLVGLPAAYAVAILRYRLYDIDIVINRTLVFAGLAVFVTGTYVLVVAGAGALIGSTNQSSFVLSILATAVVAVAFQPVRQRAQSLANRLVYGSRADPHEVLSRVSKMVADTGPGEQMLVRMLQMLVESTSVTAAAIYLDVGVERVLAAGWPEGATNLAGCSLPIRHRGDEIGHLVVAEPAESLAADTERLLGDVAGQAGLLMRNQRLTAELEARVDELAESRLRIVAAQDAERRRLERDIHDGVQQHVVALMAKVRLARNQIRRRSELAADTLGEVQADAGRLLDELRELASGIHPVVLTDGGVVAAVRSRADRLPIEVVLDADSTTRTRRYPEQVEAAGYFIACEALANVMKHAGASRAVVRIGTDGGSLTIKVSDDGKGFDTSTAVRSGLRGLQDRVEALGGRMDVTSSHSLGTTLSASLPADG
ncbi:MAG TPA: sensor histidine kinase [Candidatus Limnocylindrales bacterium]|nr:sensor histidine kinase [Candidatus Limnocylindrales bacterium]